MFFEITKGVRSGASIVSEIKEEMMQTDVAVEISEHVAQENQNRHQIYESESDYCKCSLFYLLYRSRRTFIRTKKKKKKCYR